MDTGVAAKVNSERIKSFSGLVEKIEGLSEEKRLLYREIYENAITDRQNAYMMFEIIVGICQENTTEHAVHGRSVATYIEKMSKANEQLIRLADLIRRAEEKNDIIDPDEMFNQIQRGRQ